MMNSKEQNLLTQAVKLFSMRGYDAVGVNEIAQSCGVTKPTLYHYFGSKSGLLSAIYKTYLPSMLNRIHIFEKIPNNDLKSTLETLTREWAKQTKEESFFFRFLLSASYAPQESEMRSLLRPYENALFVSMQNLFISATKLHGNIKGHEALYARLFLGTLHILSLDILDGQLKITQEEIYQRIHQFMHGILS